ncbi:LysM peptidoglycan-binding domain-containing protein [Micrococcus porci]|uniref:lytic transglycosylase domain-containing protein n=1 Tax=Micrococcus porci TaxID=2856555 RepID=UPI003CEC15C9
MLQPAAPRASTTTARRSLGLVAGGVVPLLMTGALPAAAQAAEAADAAPRTHTVRAGENPYRIAEAEGVRLSDLLRLNGLRADSVIYAGQVLDLTGAPAPAAAPGTVEVERGEGWWQVSRRAGVDAAVLQRINGLGARSMLHPGQILLTEAPARPTTPATPVAAAPAPVRQAAPTTYTVRNGDSMWSISQRVEVSIPRLRELNGLTWRSVLHTGDVLVIADGTEQAPVIDGPVGSTFLSTTYAPHVTASANDNLRALQAVPQPSPAEVQALVRQTALELGVDPALALGHAYTESRFQHASVSPGNAIGAMQVIPITGEFASQLVGRELNVLDVRDNVTAGVVLIKYLQEHTDTVDQGISAYFTGLGGSDDPVKQQEARDYVARVKAAAAMF